MIGVDLQQCQRIYFIGIGGIGMSALARYFHRLGKQVCGYDKTPTELTGALQSEGISVHFEDSVNQIPEEFRDKEHTLVVVTPAVPKDHKEWRFFSGEGYTILKRSAVLGMITRNTFCYAVAGTHGKTTTSAILGHILYTAGVEMTAFLGGIAENYQSNLVGTGSKITVVEADEFDRSFLQLYPDVACVTSMDADHLDIYGDTKAIEDSFREFASRVEDPSRLFFPKGLPLKGQTLAIEEPADFEACHVRIDKGKYVFDVRHNKGIIKEIRFGLPGRHNLMNALTALAMAVSTGVSEESVRKALESFRGIQRRFSYQIETEQLVYIDDYAHHPTEINAVHQAVRELYPGQKVLAVFQPHLFSRTRDFEEEFGRSLSAFDEVILLDIYPARELPVEGVTSEALLNRINLVNKQKLTKEELIEAVSQSDAKVIVTLGAGDIGAMVKSIKDKLYEKVL